MTPRTKGAVLAEIGGCGVSRRVGLLGDGGRMLWSERDDDGGRERRGTQTGELSTMYLKLKVS